MTTVTSFDSLDELRRAFRSLRSDEPAVTRWADAAPVRWVVARGERVVLVCGCGRSSGSCRVRAPPGKGSSDEGVVEVAEPGQF